MRDLVQNLVTTTYVGFNDNKRVLGHGEAGAKNSHACLDHLYENGFLSNKPERKVPPPPKSGGKTLIL